MVEKKIINHKNITGNKERTGKTLLQWDKNFNINELICQHPIFQLKLLKLMQQ